jgi:GT2 family glycosyltransferase
MTSPLVSVIVPAYNASQTIRETIDSILAQTLTDFELIIVDDGSTDDTAFIISGFTDERIQYFYQPNNERSAARNQGITLAKASYIAFIDADDLWLPGKLERQVALLKKKPELGLVYCDVFHFDGHTGENIFRYSQEAKLHHGRVAWQFLLNENFIQSPTPIVRKEVLQDVGLFDPDLIPVEDWDMWFRIARKYPINFVNQPLARYRVCHYRVNELDSHHQRYLSTLRFLDKTCQKLLSEGHRQSIGLVQRAIALTNYRHGVILMRNREDIQAIEMFKSTVKGYPFYPKTYIRLFQSLIRHKFLKR